MLEQGPTKAARREQRKQAKKAYAESLRSAAAAAAKLRVAAFRDSSPIASRDSPVIAAAAAAGERTPELPTCVWTEILLCIDAGRDATDATQDVCLSATSICAAGCASRDLRRAATDALLALLPPPANPDVALACADPSRLVVPRLQGVCRSLGLQVGGTKPMLIVRILDAVGLGRPRRDAPVSLMLEAGRQKRQRWRQHGAFASAVSTLAHSPVWQTISTGLESCAALWTARRVLAKHGVDGDTVREMDAWKRRQADEAREAQLRRNREFVEVMLARERERIERACPCCRANMGSPSCAFHTCGRCCPDRANCPRHRSKERGGLLRS
jgi:hypothetical protein